MKQSVFRFAGSVAVLAALGVCLMGGRCGGEELSYLAEQAPGQFKLLVHRVPFEKVLADPDLDPAVREKLELVLDVKRYGVDKLGLHQSKNYEIYVEIEEAAVSWNLTACAPLSLTPVTWDFPVVGEMPYLGFFKRDDADRKAAELASRGYDVYVRPAGAYSMLGIVSDPLYSPLTKMRTADLANLVLHEMLHSTVFIKGQMEFNENLALFVGNQGSYEYLVERFGEKSEEAEYSRGSNIDDATFSLELMALYDELDAMYKSDLSDADKAAAKERIIADHKRRFREEVLPAMETDAYAGWPDKDINNATVISRAVYFHDLSLYERLYRALGGTREVVDFFREVQERQGVDAEEYAKEWLADRE